MGIGPRLSKLKRALSPVVAVLVLLAGAAPAGAAGAGPSPRLVVVIVADQFPYDYLERFSPLLHGGLRRLLDEGLSFRHATHAHALTATCPGHASLLTGLHPSHSGIVANRWLDRQTGRTVYCVGDAHDRRSPRRLRATALGDWLRVAHPEARVFSASGKDRAAVIMGGQHPDGAFWYDKRSGGFTSSRYYYPDGVPAWVRGFTRRRRADAWFGRGWRPAPVEAAAARAAGVVALDAGVFRDAFPHPLGDLSLVPDTAYYDDLFRSPAVDTLLAGFARALVEREGLGRDRVPDLLTLSFSALDTVGHRYGPNSAEVLDTVLNLDRELGDLLAFLERRVGAEHLLVAFSSDHGVQALPELRRQQHRSGRRLAAADVACVQNAGRRLQAHYRMPLPWRQGFYLDRQGLARLGIDRADLDRRLKRELEGCGFIERVWSSVELETGAGNGGDIWRRLFVNGHDPERSPDYELQMVENFTPVAGRGADHGSPYGYDRHVPLLLRGGGLAAGVIDTPVETVDLAPTLAGLLGLAGAVPADLDGRDRSSRLRAPR